MDWADIKLLLTFAEKGTLEAAGEHLGVQASTVSRRIRALEKTVGTKVVENVAGRLVLTAAGEAAAETARQMRVHAEELERRIAGRDQQLRGELRVGLLEVAVRFHAEAFASFAHVHPEIRLELLVQGSSTHRLTQREADVVLRVTKRPPETLVGRPVLDLEYAAFAASPLSSGADFDPRDHRWVGWHESLHATVTEDWLASAAGLDRVVARVTTTPSMLDLALAGVGACVVPTLYGHAVGLRQLSPALDGFRSQLWLLTHRDLSRSAKVRAFMRHLGAYFRAIEVPDG